MHYYNTLDVFHSKEWTVMMQEDRCSIFKKDANFNMTTMQNFSVDFFIFLKIWILRDDH